MPIAVDKLRQLAAQGASARTIAAELGVSRQAVYLQARRHQISLTRYHDRKPAPPPPIARVITGGIPARISHSTAGTIAELLAAADLMARGWQVFFPLVRSTGHDLIAAKGAALLTIEVRSAYRNGVGKLIYARKPDSRSDHYALVVTGEPVSYEPALL